MEPCALLALTTTPPIVPQNPSLLFFQSLASTERSELGNGVGGTGAAAQKRFYLIAYIELFFLQGKWLSRLLTVQQDRTDRLAVERRVG